MTASDTCRLTVARDDASIQAVGRRLLCIVAGTLALVVLSLAATSPALAQGGNSPSAGDNQYVDPLATNAPSHPAKKHRAGTPKRSSVPAASSGSSTPSEQSYGSNASASASTGAPASATPGGSSTAGAPPRHPARATHRSRTKHGVTHHATTLVAAPVSAGSSPASAVTPPSHADGTSPFVYVVIGVCAIAGVGLLARRLLLRRTLRRA